MSRFDMVIYGRGQVWWVEFPKSVQPVGHEQLKSRPHVILSVEKFNKSSGMITIAPITTRDKASTPSQVQFTNDSGDSNVILCEHVKTIDYSSGAYILKYMGQLSDEIMREVDKALSTHLGMHYSPMTLNSLYDSIESIVRGIQSIPKEDKNLTENDLNEIANKIKVKVKELVIHDTGGGFPKNDSNSTVIADVQESPKTIINEVSAEETPTVNKRSTVRMKWTDKVCREFLEDANTLPMKKVMEKWSITQKTRFYSMKNYAQFLLDKKKI